MEIKKISILFAAGLLLCGCHESLEQRAEREAREYTEKNCPTPVQNYTRTDSVVFDVPTKTYRYYCTVSGILDDRKVFDINRGRLSDALRQAVQENTGFRAYKEAGFSFAWILRSEKDKRTVYFEHTFTPKEYGTEKK